MASGGSMKKFCEELSCPVCLEYFKEPVMIISCGHHFCQSCLDQCWEGKEASCPQCREKVQQRGIKRNWQLANLVEIAKELGSQKAEEKGRVCQRHQEPLKLFCKHHEAPICVVCDRSKEHENHNVIPLDEASKEYKDRIGNFLESLKKEREKILAFKADAARESQDVLERAQREKDKAVAAFRLMHQFLEEQETNFLAKIEEVEREISAKGEEHLARLSKELSSLSKLIQEMEEKHHQPASELLQVGRHYKKKGKFGTPVAFSPALKWKICDICDINPFLEGVMKQLRVRVTLDPDTAHPQLILSEDRRRVTLGEKRQYLPDNPERFNRRLFVLGQEGFRGGRHFWEVLVKDGKAWSVGVARKSVQRKGFIPDGPDAGIWEVEKGLLEYRFYSNNGVIRRLILSEEPKRVRVTLNCEGGRVAFYDADSAALIYEFPPASFSRETLVPFFSVCFVGQLELSS
uniref:Zinc finger protein RFP-like n=1 Tax=Anolis carolinensis TaxID=28377 RepID=G1KHY6_ANOCA